MSASTAVQRGRLAALELMVDTAVVTRPGGDPTLNTTTGLLTAAEATEVVPASPCRLRQAAAQAADEQFGEQHVTTTKFVACFPHDTTGITIGDVVTFTVTDDPDAADRTFRVVAVPSSTFTLYKAYPVEVVE